MTTTHVSGSLVGGLVFAALAVWSLWSGRTFSRGGFVSRQDSPFWYSLIVATYAVVAVVLLWP